MDALRQRWEAVAFLHWRVDPAALAARLPPRLTLDEHDNAAWVSVVPLRLANLRPVGMPALPVVSTFAQTNMRTYVRGPDGEPGLWFLSVDAARLWVTLGAQLLLGAPYRYAHATVSVDDGDVRYSGHRRLHPDVSYEIHVRPGPALQPRETDRWLTDRLVAYTRHAGRLLRTPVRHPPWRLRKADVVSLREQLTVAAQLPVLGRPDVVHFSDGVDDVVFGLSSAA
jgi:uncharacterized protein YqjF (DUF2071 family)